MDVWNIYKWERKYNLNTPQVRTGLRFRFDKNIDPEVKRACKEFAKWLRYEFEFPIRICVYVKASERIKCQNGDLACGRLIMPYNVYLEPYATIATGDYRELVEERGQDNALASIIVCIAHELSHYFQWINDIDLTEKGLEIQATFNARKRLDEYEETREHP